jgi:hypothetical protein
MPPVLIANHLQLIGRKKPPGRRNARRAAENYFISSI